MTARYPLAAGAALLLSITCGCASGPATRAKVQEAPASTAPLTAAVSYDWHPLVLVPFGTLLKQSPLPLHEVLLFQNQAQDDGNEGKDCFAPDGAPPTFAGRPLDGYLLCFQHDRLHRIEATLRLPAAAGRETLGALCAEWQKSSGSAGTAAEDGCEGRDGATGFGAHLGEDAGQSGMTLIVGLYSVIEP
jgi:hypothetical protein